MTKEQVFTIKWLERWSLRRREKLFCFRSPSKVNIKQNLLYIKALDSFTNSQLNKTIRKKIISTKNKPQKCLKQLYKPICKMFLRVEI